jgi:hypothetical protein
LWQPFEREDSLWSTINDIRRKTGACNININIPHLNTGPTQTLAINEPAPVASVKQVDLAITMGAGKLNLSGGARGLVEGQVSYNVAEWKPTVTHTGNSVTIDQGQMQNYVGLPQAGSNIVNDWQLRLGSTPLALTVNAGAYQGSLSLGGVPLHSLTIHDGASNAKLTFDTPNPESLDILTYATGASTVSLQEPANANTKEIDFTGGAGDYELDFSGQLQHDISATVKSGVSSVRMVVPQGTAAKVNVTGGLNNVNTDGNWTHAGDSYTQVAQGATITIKVDMGVGSLKLVNK